MGPPNEFNEIKILTNIKHFYTVFLFQIASLSESDLAQAVRLQLLQPATFIFLFQMQAICSLTLPMQSAKYY